MFEIGCFGPTARMIHYCMLFFNYPPYRPCKGLSLNLKQRRLRHKWKKERRGWRVKDLKKIFFFDETAIVLPQKSCSLNSVQTTFVAKEVCRCKMSQTILIVILCTLWELKIINLINVFSRHLNIVSSINY